MKKLAYKLTLLGCLPLCLASVAQAEVKLDDAWEPDVEFISEPTFTDINCGSSPTNATYTVRNNEDVGIILSNPNLPFPKIINNDSFPNNLITVEVGGLTTCPLDNGTKLGAHKTCKINLIITPPSCPITGPLEGDIDRVLVVGVDTLQVDMEAGIHFRLTPTGAGDAFAILGSSVFNNQGVSRVRGSVGHTDGILGSIDLNFSVTDGQLYLSATDPAVIAAQSAFTALYNLFNTQRATYGCTPRGDLDDGDRLDAATYCLQNVYDTNVSIEGEITLNGGPDSEFVFFVGANNSGCFTPPSPFPANYPGDDTSYSPCNLDVLPDTYFIYEGGASPDNVYWIVGNGQVHLFNGSSLDGNVLAGGGPIFADQYSNNPTYVHGRLWSNFAITLYGNSVSIP